MERLRSIAGASSSSGSSGGNGQQKVELMKTVCNSINYISSYHCCAICTETYVDPRALPCLHTFCFRCLDEYFKGHGSRKRRSTSAKKTSGKLSSSASAAAAACAPDDEEDDMSLSCPLCRREFKLPPEGAAGLPRNVFAEDLVAITGITGRVCAPCEGCLMNSSFDDDDGFALETVSGAEGWNDLAGGAVGGSGRRSVRQGAIASMWCTECRQNLCDRCFKLHKKLKTSKAHKIIAISSKEPPPPPHLVVSSVVGELPEGQALSGVAVLNDEIYVVRVLSRLIDVYNSTTGSLTRHVSVPGLQTPQDMAACETNKCVYVSDRAVHCIHRIALTSRRRRLGDSAEHRRDRVKITNWPVEDWPAGLSVTSDGNVVVACKETRRIKIFTTDGVLQRNIILPLDVVHPWQAVCTPSGQLVVCHGTADDLTHRVVLLDSDGRAVLATYGSSRGSGSDQLNVPVRLAIDSRSFIIVADFNNARLVLLSPSNLTVVRDFVPSAATGSDVVSRIRCPLRLCLDEKHERLYVGDQSRDNGKWADSRVLILATRIREDSG